MNWNNLSANSFWHDSHRLLFNKDCRAMTEIPDEYAQMVVTSPPYNCGKMDGDDLSQDDYFRLLRDCAKECLRVSQPGAFSAWNLPWWFSSRPKIYTPTRFEASLTELGWEFKDIILWVKGNPESPQASGTGWGNFPFYPRFRMASEPILIFRKPGLSLKGERDITIQEWGKLTIGVWSIPGAHNKNHPSVFPDEIPRRLIKLLSPVGGIVLDPFVGSGTTLKVAAELNRRAIGYELSEQYCQLAVKRNKQTVMRLET